MLKFSYDIGSLSNTYVEGRTEIVWAPYLGTLSNNFRSAIRQNVMHTYSVGAKGVLYFILLIHTLLLSVENKI